MHAALIVIDVQKEYFAPWGQWVLPSGEEALPNIRTLIETARAAELPVIHVVHERLDPQSNVWRPGSEGVEMHPAIQVLPGEIALKKHVPGSFTGTPLDAHLRRFSVDTLIVCGFMTFMCCDTTTRQASERGYKVLFASDATGAKDLVLGNRTIPYQEVHDVTLAVMTNFATVLTGEQIAARIDGADG